MTSSQDRSPASTTHHHLRLRAELGALTLDVHTTFTAPWSILFGPSGSGKSSMLRALCGLLPSAQAQVTRHETGRQTDLTPLAPHLRNIAYAPQQPSLFPHLTVRQNIAFSSSLHSYATTLTDDALTLFDLAPLADRSPSRLSGGERQRVNLARAFAVPDARLMLLDEPFTGLDRRLRDQLLPHMQQTLAARGIPCISVTHDIEEALLLNAEVLRIDGGRILAQGPARTILADERSRLLATLRESPPQP